MSQARSWLDVPPTGLAPMPHPLIHGIDTFFGEFAANRRRVAWLLLAVSALFGGATWLAGRRVVTTVLEDPMRYGFEGQQQWVERIRLEELAERESSGLYAITYLTAEARKGDKEVVSRTPHPNAVPQVGRVPGTGADDDDLLAKARMLSLEGPIVRSEDLVIERLVRPDYPEEAHNRNIEGVVEAVALVDTSGQVLQIQIVGGTREPLLEAAAAKAILECRYRPYKVDAQALRVWAAYRISFSLY
jgi:TonB family protein